MRSFNKTSARGITLCLAVFLLGCESFSHAAEVVVIRTAESSEELVQIQMVADLYGLSVNAVDGSSAGDVAKVLARIPQSHTLAVMVAHNALPRLRKDAVMAALRRPNGAVPLMIFGIDGSSEALNSWSEGAVRGCEPGPPAPAGAALTIEKDAAMARNLAGWRLPAVSLPVCNMLLANGRTQALIAAQAGTWRSSVLIRTHAGQGEVYYAARMHSGEPLKVNPLALPEVFASAATYFLFLKHMAGDYAWHSDAQYANLTIDDPWLTESYGRLTYSTLLPEMQKHRFHTTIAFIPWNFDRSEQAVVTLFREHPEQYSICIHGDDHTHQEFGLRSTPREHVAKIKQAVARMEKFSSLTGLPYDRLMVFPHAVGREQSFADLKRYGFLGTANSLNVPSDKPFPQDAEFLLRPYTLRFANFPSLFRYFGEGQIRRADIAVQMFLGNPVLFYGHEGMFESGPGAFNATADFVNRLQPQTRWVSLGTIARHLYLMRLRIDGAYDVRMIAPEMVLSNPGPRDAVYYVERQESDRQASSVTVDGQSAEFERSGEVQKVRLSIPAGQSRTVRVTYQNDLDLAHEDISKSSLYSRALRMASDFRDLYLVRSRIGRMLGDAYYRNGLDSFELGLEHRWRVFAILFGGFVGIVWYARSRRRTNSSAARGARAVISSN
jgi:peptidoglycan/xylan/chitin deacetylase (PgdA/CDA1 family)